jgi:hypothetical protein
MSNNDKTNGYNTLKVSKFDNTSTTPRAMRWREWVFKMRYSFKMRYVRSFGPFGVLVGSDLEPSP